MKRLFFVGCLVLAASLIGQVEHAPTVDQCQADQRLWFSRLEDVQNTLPSYDAISQWHQEMNDCEKVDPDNRVKYHNVEREIDADQNNRVLHFLNRHQLWGKFIEEDAAGKR